MCCLNNYLLMKLLTASWKKKKIFIYCNYVAKQRSNHVGCLMFWIFPFQWKGDTILTFVQSLFVHQIWWLMLSMLKAQCFVRSMCTPRNGFFIFHVYLTQNTQKSIHLTIHLTDWLNLNNTKESILTLWIYYHIYKYQPYLILFGVNSH